MSDEITPALTATEWHLVQLWAAGKMPGGKVRGMVVLDLPEDHRRGAAACALYGQPFGFTQAMVDAIRRNAEFSGPDADSELALAAASRIAALLPPEGS